MPVPKENPLPVPVPPGATVVEPSAPDPKENPVDMAALGATPSTTVKRPRTLLFPHCRARTCSIAVAQQGPGGKFNPCRRAARPEEAEPHARRRPRAPKKPEAHPPRKESWDRIGGGASVRQQPGWAPRLLS